MEKYNTCSHGRYWLVFDWYWPVLTGINRYLTRYGIGTLLYRFRGRYEAFRPVPEWNSHLCTGALLFILHLFLFSGGGVLRKFLTFVGEKSLVVSVPWTAARGPGSFSLSDGVLFEHGPPVLYICQNTVQRPADLISWWLYTREMVSHMYPAPLRPCQGLISCLACTILS
jgi:hypothetical protein